MQSAAETPSVSAFPPTQSIISFQMIGTLSRKRAAFAPLTRYFGVNQGFLPFLWCALQLQQFPVSALQLGTPNERGKLRNAKQERASGANDSPFR